MTIRASVHNRSIALPADIDVAEGAEVEIILPDLRASRADQTSDWMEEFAGVLNTLPPDAAERHNELRRERNHLVS